MTSFDDKPAEPTKPSGPAAAAMVAAGIGTLVLGIMVVLAEALGADFRNNVLDFARIYGIGSGVGPLSGKVIIAVIAYLISWGILAVLWRRKEISLNRAFIATLVLVAAGFALTFPPIFLLFEA
jgi:hypothetical protein